MNNTDATSQIQPIVPSGRLLKLKPDKIKPSRNNPRLLFDPNPLKDLKENIREHGVLVPITVYQLKGQDIYEILDGARRHHCVLELKREGIEMSIPANVVDPPNKIAGLLYMFSIHNFRESWELMPTALSLQVVMKELGETDNDKLLNLTGLSTPQIERCKKLLDFAKKYQELSLDPDPTQRIPANFWIEAHPLIELCERELPSLQKKLGRDGIIDKLVEKYRAKKIKSVIHFRRIMEAYEVAESRRPTVLKRIKEYIENVDLETRAAFDQFVVDTRRVKGALKACETFISQIKRSKLDYTAGRSERAKLRKALKEVKDLAETLLSKLEGGDAPIADNDEE